MKLKLIINKSGKKNTGLVFIKIIKKTKYFKLLHESLEEVYHSKYDKLVDLNIELIKIFFNYFEINKKIKLSSDFFLNSVSNNKIIEICNLLKIDNFIVKEESENYHPKAYFKENGIKLIPINYSKLYFDCIDCKNIYLNILDLACLIGPKAFKKNKFMCGIAGYLGAKKIPKERIIKTLSLMKKRGPDNQNFKRFKIFNRYLYLLHSRLNIIDINNRSNQPFIYKDYAIIFNGEIYNFKELKKDLIKNGVVFTTTSDTEVLLKAYIFHGKKFLNFLEGMWSFVIFDNKAKELFISRDRFGEKPLYYYLNKKRLFILDQKLNLLNLSQKINSKSTKRN